MFRFILRPIWLPACIGWAAFILTGQAEAQELAWQRFVIDDSLQGADGVRMADANGDGLVDIVTGWEESGQTRAYFHPGVAQVNSPWPKVTVGQSPSIEDAVWVDLNADGQLDVLSSCEGQEQALRIHLAKSKSPLLDPNSWSTQIVESSQDLTRWMFALPFPPHQSPSRRPLIVVGSKSPNGLVGLMHYSSLTGMWKVTKLCDAQWIMSLQLVDIDGDQDLDILYSDRKGENSGVFWLENLNPESVLNTESVLDPAPSLTGGWERHLIGAQGQEVMFIAPMHDLVAIGQVDVTSQDILVAVKPNHIYQLSVGSDPREQWHQQIIEVGPQQAVGTAKGVARGDLDADGQDEIVFTCEGAVAPKSGVVYLKRSSQNSCWELHDVSGPEGIKFDLVELVDLDADGDLDILTCEERHAGRGLGVIWYANPLY